MNKILLLVKLELNIYSMYPRGNRESQAFTVAILDEVMEVQEDTSYKSLFT